MSKKTQIQPFAKQITTLTLLIGLGEAMAVIFGLANGNTSKWYAGIFPAVSFLVLGALLLKAKTVKAEQSLLSLIVLAILVDAVIQILLNSPKYITAVIISHLVLVMIYASARNSALYVRKTQA